MNFSLISPVSPWGSDTMDSTDLAAALSALAKAEEKFSRYASHEKFLSSCIAHNVIPIGMKLKFGKSALPPSDYLSSKIDDIIQSASKDILYTCRDTYVSLVQKEKDTIQKHLYHLQQETTFVEFEEILKHHHHNSKPNPALRRRKKKKLQRLLDEQPPTNVNLPIQKKRKTRRFKRRSQLTMSLTNDPETHDRGEDSNLVINLSSLKLTSAQTRLLELGPKFCPTPRTMDLQQLSHDVEEGCRKIRLKEWHYKDESDSDTDQEDEYTATPKFYKPTGFLPPDGRNKALDAYCKTLQSRTDNYCPPIRSHDNLRDDERKALGVLKELVNSRTIRITTADKGGAIVIQDTKDYLDEAWRQLNNTNNYNKLTKDPTAQIAKVSNQLATGLHQKGYIDEATYKWATVEPSKVVCHRYYNLPKVHKTLNNPPGRPIISGINGPTENLSRLVSHWLQPYVTELPSYIQDTTHMLQTIQTWNEDLGPFGQNTRLVAIDVVGLYSNIPADDLHLALSHFLSRHPKPDTPPLNDVHTIVDHILNNNVFKFENDIYIQKFGTAMGTPMAPAIANLFMAWLEDNILAESPVPVQKELWKRFIDDVFFLWMGSEEDLVLFEKHINSFHRTIKFTVQSSKTTIPFLDIQISLQDGLLQTDVHTKPTDAHGYLHCRSSHPRHVCKNIPFSQFLRLRRLCSDQDTFKLRCGQMETHFKKRGYDSVILAQARHRVESMCRSECLLYKPKVTSHRPPLVVGHHPCNPPFRRWLRELHDSIIVSDQRMRRALPVPPVVGERNCRSLRSLLMPTVLRPVPDVDPGCFRCEKERCVVCKDHLVDTRTFASSQTGQQFTIRDRMTCETANVVYLLYCDICPHTQYVGQTKNSLRTRFYLHRSNINTNTGTYVSTHFNKPDHSLLNLKCVAIEKVHMDSLSKRLERETFWIMKIKTLFPQGLNATD